MKSKDWTLNRENFLQNTVQYLIGDGLTEFESSHKIKMLFVCYVLVQASIGLNPFGNTCRTLMLILVVLMYFS